MKCGFVRAGENNEKMTLAGYVKNCVNARRFEEEDADEVSKLIVRNFLEVNSKVQLWRNLQRFMIQGKY